MDYKEIGFMCGLEIHQQLDTRKLFCNCPSIVHDTNPDIKFFRKLKALAGETGEVDIAARHEEKKEKLFNYIGCSTSCCLVEMDEEPPHEINQDAVKVAVEVCNLLNARIVDEIQVMRKTVIDGSNVGGFQRTALVGMDGHIDTSQGKVSISLVCLEEEAAKKVKEEKNSVTFRLDRLGIPLLEIATGTEIVSPEHAKEVAHKIGMILRSAEDVKRGIGTIRQDVNISIKGGARTEIKGFQDYKNMPKVIENEIKRQQSLIKKGKKPDKEVRKAEQDGTTSFLRPLPGAARMYPETDVLPVRITKDMLESIGTTELIDDRIKRFEKDYKLAKDLAALAAKSGKAALFDKLAKEHKSVKPAFIAETIISRPLEVKRKHNVDISKIKDEDFTQIISLLDQGGISKDSVSDIILDLAKTGKFDPKKYGGVDEAKLEAEIKKIIEKNKGAPLGALMGMIMSRFKGKADGRKVMDILKKLTS